MQRFTSKIVSMMKQENLYASQGGPIILSQVINLRKKLKYFMVMKMILSCLMNVFHGRLKMSMETFNGSTATKPKRT